MIGSQPRLLRLAERRDVREAFFIQPLNVIAVNTRDQYRSPGAAPWKKKFGKP
jgi:hypothetical protein